MSDKRPTIYMTDGVGTAKTNAPKMVKQLREAGYRVCDHDEYARVNRRLRAEERKAFERERQEEYRVKRQIGGEDHA